MTDQKNVLGWQDLGLGSFSSDGQKINFTELDFLEVWRTVVDSDVDLTSQTLVAGSKATCLAWVFVAGYQSAIRRVFPRSEFSGWTAFAVSEDRKNDPPLPGVDYSKREDGTLLISGVKTWVASVEAISEIIIKAGKGNRALYIKLPRETDGLSFSGRKSRFLEEMSQGSAHLDRVSAPEQYVLEDVLVGHFGRFETLYIYLAFLAFIGSSTRSDDLKWESFRVAMGLKDVLDLPATPDNWDWDAIKNLDLEVQKILGLAGEEFTTLQPSWSVDSRLISMYSPGIQKQAN